MDDRAARPAPAPAPLVARLSQIPLLHVALIVLVGVAAYANTFQAPFELDDNRRMLDLPYVQTLRYLTDWPLFRQFAVEHDFRLRFVGYLSFALNYAAGGPSVTGYHLVNLAIHLANALLVYFLVRLTARVSGLSTDGTQFSTPNFMALVAALLFVAHPVQTESVTYVVQRLTSLAAFFYLACLLLYVRAREALSTEGWGWRALRRYGASLVCALLAMKTKEIAFTLPLTVCLYEFMFLRGSARCRVTCLAPLLVTMLIIPVTLLANPGAGAAAGHLGALAKASSVISRSDYLATELRVIVTYIRLLFLPVGQNFVYDYPVFHSFLAPQVLLSLLFLLALFGLAAYLTYRSGGKLQGPTLETHNSRLETQNQAHYRLIAFGIFWFFLALSVESSFIPIDDVIFEHRLYLPSVGFFVALAAALELVRRRTAVTVRGGEKAVLVLATLAVVVLAGATFARNAVWSSEERLWRDVVEKSPNRPLGYQYFGLALAEKGDVEGAFASFDRSLALDPGLAEGYCNRGTLYARIGRYAEAAADLSRAISLDPSYVESWSNLGLVYSELGDQEKAIEFLRRAVALDPGYAKAQYNLGLALTRKGLVGEAISHFDRAIALVPTYVKAYFNRGIAYVQSGQFDRGVADLTRAIALDPAYAEAYVQRGNAFAGLGREGEAIADFKTACDMKNEAGCSRLQMMTGR